jgi:hypothetical protein
VTAGLERSDALRRILPQALVVACLAGGTTAYVTHDGTPGHAPGPGRATHGGEHAGHRP